MGLRQMRIDHPGKETDVQGEKNAYEWDAAVMEVYKIGGTTFMILSLIGLLTLSIHGILLSEILSVDYELQATTGLAPLIIFANIASSFLLTYITIRW